jgi:hypothetical protein
VPNFSAFFTYAKTWFGIVLSAWLWGCLGVSRSKCRGPRLRRSRVTEVSRLLESGFGSLEAWSGGVLRISKFGISKLRISKRKISKFGISKYL